MNFSPNLITIISKMTMQRNFFYWCYTFWINKRPGYGVTFCLTDRLPKEDDNCLIEFCNQNHSLKVLRFVIIVRFFPNVCRILGHWNAYASGFAQVTDFMFTSGHSLVTKYKQKKTVFESMFGENKSEISLHVRFVVILWNVYFFKVKTVCALVQ